MQLELNGTPHVFTLAFPLPENSPAVLWSATEEEQDTEVEEVEEQEAVGDNDDIEDDEDLEEEADEENAA